MKRATAAIAAVILALVQADASYKPSRRTLIEERVVSASTASVDFTQGIDAAYSIYIIEYWGAKPATDDDWIRFRVGTGSGPTWATGSTDYDYYSMFEDDDDGEFRKNSQGDSHIAVGGGGAGGGGQAGWGIGSGADEGGDGVIRVYDPSNAGKYTEARFTTTHVCAGGGTNDMCHVWGSGRYTATTAVTGLQFAYANGDIASGVFRLYGVR